MAKSSQAGTLLTAIWRRPPITRQVPRRRDPELLAEILGKVGEALEAGFHGHVADEVGQVVYLGIALNYLLARAAPGEASISGTVASGLYLCRMKAGGTEQQMKMMLVR